MISHISFFHLPLLLQWKILRQYVPFSDKVTILNNMAEFTEYLLNPDNVCWLRASNDLYQLLPTLSGLSPGFYVETEKTFPFYGYYVDMNRENCVSFTCCKCFFSFEAFSIPMKATVRLFQEPIDSLRNFIHFFLSRCALAKHLPIRVYQYRRSRFMVNRARRKLVLENGCVYDILSNGECFIKDDILLRVEEDTVKVKQEAIGGDSLESLVVFSGTRVYSGNKLFKCSFSIDGSGSVTRCLKIYKAYKKYQSIFSWFNND